MIPYCQVCETSLRSVLFPHKKHSVQRESSGILNLSLLLALNIIRIYEAHIEHFATTRQQENEKST